MAYTRIVCSNCNEISIFVLFLINKIALDKTFYFTKKYWLVWSLTIQSTLFITKTRLFKYIVNFNSKKTEIFQMKNSDIFHIIVQNIDCWYSLEPPRRGGSNGYPQSMFSSRNKKNNVYPCKPQFYCIKVGFKGVKII